MEGSRDAGSLPELHLSEGVRVRRSIRARIYCFILFGLVVVLNACKTMAESHLTPFFQCYKEEFVATKVMLPVL